MIFDKKNGQICDETEGVIKWCKYIENIYMAWGAKNFSYNSYFLCPVCVLKILKQLKETIKNDVFTYKIFQQ